MDLDRYPSHNTCKSNIDQDQSIYSWVSQPTTAAVAAQPSNSPQRATLQFQNVLNLRQLRRRPPPVLHVRHERWRYVDSSGESA